MADGELTLKLDDETTLRLKTAAEAVGSTVEDYVADLIHGDLDADRYAEAAAALAEYDRTGENIPVEVALAEFRSSLDERLARRG